MRAVACRAERSELLDPYLGVDVQGRPELTLRVFFTAFDDAADDVHGAPELPALGCDVDEPVVLRLLPCEVLVPRLELLDDLRLIVSGSIRGSDPVS